MLKLKLQPWPPDVKNWLTGEDPDAGKDWKQEEKGAVKDEIVGWCHQLDGHEFEQDPRRVGHDWKTELNWMLHRD